MLALVPFSNRCGTPQSTSLKDPVSLLAHRLVSTPFRAQPLLADTSPGVWLWYHLYQPKPTASKYCPLWAFPFGLPLKVSKTHLLGRGLHTLIKNASFSSPTDVGSHNPPPSEPKVLASTRSLLQSMWDPSIHPPSGPSVLTSTPPRVHPLLGLASLLTHRLMSDYDTICNSPSPPLANIALFRLSLEVSKTHLLGRGLHILIKNVSFSSPTDAGSHKIK